MGHLLGHGHAGHMQVAAQLLVVGDLKDHLVHFCAPVRGALKGLLDTQRILSMDKGLEVDQQPVFSVG